MFKISLSFSFEGENTCFLFQQLIFHLGTMLQAKLQGQRLSDFLLLSSLSSQAIEPARQHI